MRLRPVALLLWGLLASGCTLLDFRAREPNRLTIAPPGELAANQTLRVRIETAGDATRAHLLVDGAPLPKIFPVNQWLDVDVGSIPEGPHRLSVLAIGAQPPMANEERTLLIDRAAPTATFTVDPANQVSAQPFVVEVSFSEPVRPVPSWSPVAFCRTIPSTGDCSVTVSEDSLRARIEFARPLSWFVEARVWSKVMDRAGNLATATAAYSQPAVAISFDRSLPLHAGNVLAFTATPSNFTSTAPLAVFVDDTLLGWVAGPQPWNVVLDVSAVSTGIYTLQFMVPGFHWSFGAVQPTMVIDRTPPALVGCQGVQARPEGLIFNERIEVDFDEPMGPATLTLKSSAGDIPFWPSTAAAGYTIAPTLDTSTLPLPLTVTVGFAGSPADLAGNPVTPSPTCNLTYPAFVFAPGATETPSGPVSAEAVTGTTSDYRNDHATMNGWSSLAWIGGSATGDTGRLLLGRMLTTSVALTLYPTALNQSPGSTVSEFAMGLFSSYAILPLMTIEHQGIGPGLVYFSEFAGASSTAPVMGPLNLDSSQDARQLSMWCPASGVSCAYAVVAAWSEATPAGDAALRFWQQSGYPTSLGPLPSIAPAPGETLEKPVVTACRFASTYTEQRLIAAFVSRTAGCAARVVVATLAKDAAEWTTAVASANRDPTQDASDAALFSGYGMALAWVEGGQVLIRRSATSLEVLGPIEVMNLDPAQPARGPQFQRLESSSASFRLVFVESGPAGDRIVARRWSGTAWLPPRMLETGGVVRTLGTLVNDTTASVTWIDGTGLVHAAQVNE
jgi:hypothetical protein